MRARKNARSLARSLASAPPHRPSLRRARFLEAGSYTFEVCGSSDEATCAKANTHTVVIPQTVSGL